MGYIRYLVRSSSATESPGPGQRYVVLSPIDLEPRPVLKIHSAENYIQSGLFDPVIGDCGIVCTQNDNRAVTSLDRGRHRALSSCR